MKLEKNMRIRGWEVKFWNETSPKLILLHRQNALFVLENQTISEILSYNSLNWSL